MLEEGSVPPVKAKKARTSRVLPTRSGISKKSAERNGDKTTREEIIRAATDAFAAHGYDGTTNKMIASQAGIAPGLIYHYFDSKRDLFSAVYSSITRDRYARSQAVIESEVTIGGKIESLAQDLVDMWKEDSSYVEFHARTLYEAQHEEGLRYSLRGARRELEDMWTGIVEEAKRRGELPDSLATNAVTDMCISWFTGLVMLLPARGAERTLAATYSFVRAIFSLSDQRNVISKSIKPPRS
jgi:AcrR family transcriptional regulator